MNLRLEIREIVESILNEGKNPSDVVDFYLKNEPNLIQQLKANDGSLLKKIASLDIEYNPEKFEVGKIFPWLLNLWRKNDSKLMDLLNQSQNSESVNKFKEYQRLFNQPKFKKSIQVSDINKFKSIDDFVNIINDAFYKAEEIPYQTPESLRFSLEEVNKDIADGIIMKTNLSNDDFLVISPLKKKGACKYGNIHMEKGAGRWCTANEENNAFDSYKDGILYIFMEKGRNLKSVYQFYYKEGNFQFMDERNRRFNYQEFFDEHIDVFDKLFPEIVKALNSVNKEKQFSFSKQIIEFFPSEYKKMYFENLKNYSSGLLADLIEITKGRLDPEIYFEIEGKIGFDYKDITVYSDRIEIICDLDNIDEMLSYYKHASQYGYENFEMDTSEYEYFYSYIQEKDKQTWIDILKVFDNNFDESKFDEEGYIDSIIGKEPAYKYFEELYDNFKYNYESAYNNSQDEWIDETLDKLPFDLKNNGITLYYLTAEEYCLKHSLTDIKSINELVEQALEIEGVNEDNYFNLYENDVSFDDLRRELSSDIYSVWDKIQDDENFENIKENKEKFDRIIKDLKFTKKYDGYSLYKKGLSIEIKKINYNDGKAYIKYLADGHEDYVGWVNFDNIAKYATMEMMLEDVSALRNKIRNILKNN